MNTLNLILSSIFAGDVFPRIPWYMNALFAAVFLAHPFVMAIKNKRKK